MPDASRTQRAQRQSRAVSPPCESPPYRSPRSRGRRQRRQHLEQSSPRRSRERLDGRAGESYLVSCRALGDLAPGRIYERSVSITIANR